MRENSPGGILCAFEHHVLENMGHPGDAPEFIARAHLVPDLRGDDRCAIVALDQHLQPIVQHLLMHHLAHWGGAALRREGLLGGCSGNAAGSSAVHSMAIRNLMTLPLGWLSFWFSANLAPYGRGYNGSAARRGTRAIHPVHGHRQRARLASDRIQTI